MISVRYILVSVLLILVNGCSGNKALESRFAPAKTTQNPEQTKTQVSPPVQISSQVELPDNFPKEIPIYSQAKLVSVDGKQTNWTSSDPLNLITEYYQQELTAQKWTISQKEDNLIIATKPDSNESIKLSLTPRNGETEFTLSYESTAEIIANPVIPENNTLPATPINVNESSSSLDELIRLNIVTEKLNPYQPITRREYARWLVKVNNLLYADVNSKLIRLANPQSEPIFTDIPQNDPDFAIIQGLAQAGLIPSTLTQDSNAVTFKPDIPVTREDLIIWKLPLDFRQKLPNATLDTIKETWGFQDAAKIKPQTWRQLYVDWQNGEESNIRRGFGYITLFQPQKPVTYEETARILTIFGYQGDIRNLKEVKNSGQ